MNYRAILLFVAIAFSFSMTLSDPVLAKGCPDRPACRGCGCKGGPGYRHKASGRCVGFKSLKKKCGSPPNPAKCIFENAPGTGANRACALGLKTKAKK